MTSLKRMRSDDRGLQDPLFQTITKTEARGGRGGEAIQYYHGNVLLNFIKYLINKQRKRTTHQRMCYLW